jgi:hypothetical protein
MVMTQQQREALADPIQASAAGCLTQDQRQALVTFSELINAQDAPPQRLVIVDATGQQVEVPEATVAALAPALAAAATLLALDPLSALPADDQTVTLGQTARLLRVSRRSIDELVAAGAIPAQERAGRRRIRTGDLRAFKARQRAAIREHGRLSEELGYDEPTGE